MIAFHALFFPASRMQAARNALRGEEVLIQMSEDWAALDIEAIIAQTFCTIQALDVPQHYMNMVPQCEFIALTTQYFSVLTTLTKLLYLAVLDGFANLLSEEKSSVEDFAVWVDDIMDKCFKKVESL